jgi:hypothetical protein
MYEFEPDSDVWLGICIKGKLQSSGTTCESLASEGIIPISASSSQTFSFTLNEAVGPVSNFSNYFFCFSPSQSGGFGCDSYSPLFNIGAAAAASTAVPGIDPPTTTMTVGQASSSTQLQAEGTILTVAMPAISTFTPAPTITGTSTSIAATVTVTTGSLTPTTSAVTITGSSNSGLSTGAKIGIAIGALGIFGLILLAILFFLRRKHAKRSAHMPLDSNQPQEQVMLTRSMHTDSFDPSGNNGRSAILAEKEEASSSATAILRPESNSSNSSPTQLQHPTETETRHVVAPYVPLPSLPYSGNAASAPRRNPTNATVASTVSRNISAASALSSGPISPRSQTTPTEEFSPYHDVPIYGDARHSPQIFQGHGHSHKNSTGSVGIGGGGERALGTSSPFVTDEMTPEEIARLEEEERRIDAAIAEAERR